LFLLSRTVDPETQIPFADKEIQDRLRDQQVTGPFFSGTTADGDQISFSAEKLTTPDGSTGANVAQDVRADLALAGGTNVTITADKTSFDIASDLVELAGSVNITTSTGFALQSDLLTSEMSALNIASPGEVRGNAPIGTLSAGAMTLKKQTDGDAAQLIFTNGVKLVYSPQESKE
jgi:lipopolysaccharide export system protein LptC